MAKIMLVEDDNNLREIYEARLLAEGYEIVAAHDGEEALAMAVKEQPDLIIADVMMPKISGFDMLDILRTTPETRDTKVIMMTALSQAEDKERATKLGADKYLVKSQVTLEDVARVAREVIEGKPDNPIDTGAALPTPAPDALAGAASGQPTAAAVPASPPADPVAAVPLATPPPATTTQDEAAKVQEQINNFAAAPSSQAASASNDDPKTDDSGAVQDEKTSDTAVNSKVIQPINDPSKEKSNLDELLAKEDAKEAEATSNVPAQPIVGDMKDGAKPEEKPGTPQNTDKPADPNSIAL